MDSLSIWPQAASAGVFEKGSRFALHSLTLATGGNGENKSDKFRKRKLSFSGEILRGLLIGRMDFFGDDVKKSLNVINKLA
jgi:hypothetical protein